MVPFDEILGGVRLSFLHHNFRVYLLGSHNGNLITHKVQRLLNLFRFDFGYAIHSLNVNDIGGNPFLKTNVINLVECFPIG